MAPCHIPEYRSPEYEQAFNELWALACRGHVTMSQVRQEMSRLHQDLVMAPASAPIRRQSEDMAVLRRLGPEAFNSALAALEPWADLHRAG